MECLIACSVSTLDACAHLLVADVTSQLPSTLGDFFDILDWFHEYDVTKADFGNPNCTKQMSPF